MTIMVTGGAGFIGRWVVKQLLQNNNQVVIVDNLDNGRKCNLDEFKHNKNLIDFIIGDIRDKDLINKLFLKYEFTICIHLAAKINVQDSLENPDKVFENNVVGTFNLLNAALKTNTKIVLVGTCMVYDLADTDLPISENHIIKPTSPYAGSKVAAEELALSYHYSFGLPVVVLRPFNTYGPFQKTNIEGGVVAIFIKRKLEGQKLIIFGNGTQTRDLLYVEDCAEFILKASELDNCIGQVINAGTGRDISINNLAYLIVKDKNRIEHREHHHPQSEIMKLVCDNSKAKQLLNWEPKISLEDGIIRFEEWLKDHKE